MLYNNAKNIDIKRIAGKKLQKYICKDCNRAFYEYDHNLCHLEGCDSIQSGDVTETLYIFADCFSHNNNNKPGIPRFSGYTTIITNDRFDLEDKFNIEYINRKGFDDTTNNFGEMMGVLDGLTYFLNEEEYEVYKNVIVISDSEYVILGARDRMDKWRAKGWKNTTGEVKNKELWIRMWELVQAMKKTGVKLEFRHQKGHVGKEVTKKEDPIIYLQEKCDTLSVELKDQILAKKGL
jgi:ribonuclease HI